MSSPTSNYRVAIVHDWLVGGGAERVVEQLHKLYPTAPIYTSYCTKEWRNRLDNKVITGYLQKWPFSRLRKFIPFLRGLWFSSINLNDFDLIISSSGAEAKFIRVGEQKSSPFSKLLVALGAGEHRKGNVLNSTLTAKRSVQQRDTSESIGRVTSSAGEQVGAVRKPVHVAYIHAPTHYYWSRYEEYLAEPGFGTFNWLAKFGLKILVGPMRKWDYKAAQKPDYLIANSTYTKSAIKKYYDRDSTVIFPPVDTERFNPQTQVQKNGFLIAGRQTPYKRFDLAVLAFTKLNLSLTVIGKGPQHQKLKELAGPTIKFLTKVSDQEIVNHFQSSEAFIFPGLDDFGIVAVEALAAGTPVIAYKAGGALDYINSGTGTLFNEPTVESLAAALVEFKAEHFSQKILLDNAQKFSNDHFKSNFSSFVNSLNNQEH